MKIHDNELYIDTWDQTKWLVLSSFSFMVPSVYACIYKMYFYSVLLLLTSLVSANYWRKAIANSWRRYMDLVLAKISFIVFLSNGIIYVKRFDYIITGYSGLILLVYSYLLACKLWTAKQNNWYMYHALFHLIMMYEQLIILDSIV